jgi:hypothetical protein
MQQQKPRLMSGSSKYRFLRGSNVPVLIPLYQRRSIVSIFLPGYLWQVAGQMKYSVTEVGTRNFRVYYRVSADGEDLAGLIFIFASEKNDEVQSMLVRWCRANASRLGTGMVLRAKLKKVAGAGE